ncbi:SagB/ThcOx family dehydrogenase [Bacillus sp. APMAM]|uniref:SagB/ThcOx family dehydrogenase n=1 Tax=Margalitia sp. FSL K6-0131 TaxID=2954604 RepID=UPI000F891FE0|nr:SagB/ThcOx family dehydrogenase [Bacillus sp. APMAM]RTZ53846.1 SagB/ThcOx family dehydrogenase [Bacillus sp. SAJ1]
MVEKNFYYWSPTVHWRIEGETLIINSHKFQGKVTELFPKLYYVFQKGIDLQSLPQLFADFNPKLIRMFVRDLVTYRIVIKDLNTPKEIFYLQKNIYGSQYEEEYFLFGDNVEKYRKEQLLRFDTIQNRETIELPSPKRLPDYIINRKSTRNFNTTKPITKVELSNILSIYKQHNRDEIKYLYPSAGGVYPINIYLYIKENRVEGMGRGLYFYNPATHSIHLINHTNPIQKDSQFFTNANIFEGSAFTLYFTYYANANMDKYKGDGYYFGILDCGIMVGYLNLIAEHLGIGTCSIGEINFNKIKDIFQLKENEIYLHSVEVGNKNI